MGGGGMFLNQSDQRQKSLFFVRSKNSRSISVREGQVISENKTQMVLFSSQKMAGRKTKGPSVYIMYILQEKVQISNHSQFLFEHF